MAKDARDVLEVRFDYKRFQQEIGFKIPELVDLFYQVYGEKLSRAAVYYWFSRGSIPVERLIQLLTIVRIETGRKLDIWRYIDVPLRRAA